MEKGQFGDRKIGLEYVDFVRNAFHSWMDNVTSVQVQGEGLLNLALKQNEEDYAEWQKIVRDWVDRSKKARQEYQKIVEDNLAKMEDFLSKQEQPARG